MLAKAFMVGISPASLETSRDAPSISAIFRVLTSLGLRICNVGPTTLVLKRLCDLTTLDSTFFFSVVSFLSSIEIDLLVATHVCNDLTHALCYLMGSPYLRSCDRIVRVAGSDNNIWKLSSRIGFVPVLNWLYAKTSGTLLSVESRSAGGLKASLRDVFEILQRSLLSRASVKYSNLTIGCCSPVVCGSSRLGFHSNNGSPDLTIWSRDKSFNSSNAPFSSWLVLVMNNHHISTGYNSVRGFLSNIRMWISQFE